MCSGEPRAMLKKARGKVDPPIYTIQICIPKHGLYPVFIDSPVDCCCVICGILRVDIYISFCDCISNELDFLLHKR